MTAEEAGQLWEMPNGRQVFEYPGRISGPLRVRDLLSHIGVQNCSMAFSGRSAESAKNSLRSDVRAAELTAQVGCREASNGSTTDSGPRSPTCIKRQLVGTPGPRVAVE